MAFAVHSWRITCGHSQYVFPSRTETLHKWNHPWKVFRLLFLPWWTGTEWTKWILSKNRQIQKGSFLYEYAHIKSFFLGLYSIRLILHSDECPFGKIFIRTNVRLGIWIWAHIFGVFGFGRMSENPFYFVGAAFINAFRPVILHRWEHAARISVSESARV